MSSTTVSDARTLPTAPVSSSIVRPVVQLPPGSHQPPHVADHQQQQGSSSQQPGAAPEGSEAPVNLDRPIIALSVNILKLLKGINHRYVKYRRLQGPEPKFNNGYDDKEGHYIVLGGEEILQRYTVQEVVGKGSFGTVLRCYDEKRQETVAMKITRHGTNFRNQAKLEIDILLKLNNLPALNSLVVNLATLHRARSGRKGSFGTVLRCYDEKRQETVAMKITRHGTNFRNQAKLEIDILLKLNNLPALNSLVVKLLKVFDWQGHLVLVFELLSFNLYQLIKCTKYNGVSLDLVRKFAYQLIQTLHQLETHKPPIIHCDLKPENILLRNQNRSGIRLIDFGSACYQSRRMFRYIQSRFYRSPEVILNLDYTTAIDRWSLGCLLVEMHTGLPLFDGRTEALQLGKFVNMLGPLPDANHWRRGSFSFKIRLPLSGRNELGGVPLGSSNLSQ
ncbi:serine-threonine protein kinase, putative [Bodo saltans]|uniref:Serine-threonine protein kinase, putative n=1 Tax=Bodo saltans TaxID=75058 RepID=A0A0S4J6A5_BODSA|nr:serine-threonine protein kinase, putative [Bodo saltans]|eukprot:CUG86947.1 serine-threonine protein kinase, putative [Bodo saltans]